jgi:HPr kinase/phosphorylase
MDKQYSVPLKQIVDHFDLKIFNGPEGYESIPIANDDVNRAGLQLTGFFDYFDPSRIQIMGHVEMTYLASVTSQKRRDVFETLFGLKIPAMIISRDAEPFEECLEMAKKHNISLFGYAHSTSRLLGSMISYLAVMLAPRVTRHGVLIEAYGEGILLLGDSGIGKSETAIELVKRGHRLIADDAVEIKRVSDHTLVGSAPEIIRHYVEMRGIGVVDVRRLFGMGAIKETESIDLVINLEPWVEMKAYDRLGLESEFTEILGLNIPSLTVPVRPGRNLAIIIEVAAMNNRHKKMGYNAAKEFTDRINLNFFNGEL